MHKPSSSLLLLLLLFFTISHAFHSPSLLRPLLHTHAQTPRRRSLLLHRRMTNDDQAAAAAAGGDGGEWPPYYDENNNQQQQQQQQQQESSSSSSSSSNEDGLDQWHLSSPSSTPSSSSSFSTLSPQHSSSSTTDARIPWIKGRPQPPPRRRGGGGNGGGGRQTHKGSSSSSGSNNNNNKNSRSGRKPANFRGVRTSLSETDEQGRFIRSPSAFRNWIGDDSKYRAQPNRYHLYVSLACPWSTRCLMTMYLKGLDNVISVSVTHPTWTRTRVNDEMDHHTGWVFRQPKDPPMTSPLGFGRFNCEGCIHDYINGARTVRELYDMARDTNGKYTVPVLWDKRTDSIVNNESEEICRMLNREFDALAMNPGLDLHPQDLEKPLEEYNRWLYEAINDGVYRCGFATSQDAYEEALESLFQGLDHAESLLSKQRYLLGDRLTEADVRLFQTLVRFDEVYHPLFKCNRKMICKDYAPNLLNYARELFQMPGVALSVNMQHIKTHFYSSHPSLNQAAIVPVGPRFLNELYLPHDRERFPRRRMGLW